MCVVREWGLSMKILSYRGAFVPRPELEVLTGSLIRNPRIPTLFGFRIGSMCRDMLAPNTSLGVQTTERNFASRITAIAYLYKQSEKYFNYTYRCWTWSLVDRFENEVEWWTRWAPSRWRRWSWRMRRKAKRCRTSCRRKTRHASTRTIASADLSSVDDFFWNKASFSSVNAFSAVKCHEQRLLKSRPDEILQILK